MDKASDVIMIATHLTAACACMHNLALTSTTYQSLDHLRARQSIEAAMENWGAMKSKAGVSASCFVFRALLLLCGGLWCSSGIIFWITVGVTVIDDVITPFSWENVWFCPSIKGSLPKMDDTISDMKTWFQKRAITDTISPSAIPLLLRRHSVESKIANNLSTSTGHSAVFVQLKIT